jgi:hypothetical protein
MNWPIAKLMGVWRSFQCPSSAVTSGSQAGKEVFREHGQQGVWYPTSPLLFAPTARKSSCCKCCDAAAATAAVVEHLLLLPGLLQLLCQPAAVAALTMCQHCHYLLLAALLDQRVKQHDALVVEEAVPAATQEQATY